MRLAARPETRVDAHWLGGGALAVGLLALVVPLLVAPVPPLWDYPNHLARLWLLSGGAALVTDWYRVTWGTLTNVGMDFAGMLAARVVGWEMAGRLAVAAAVLLPPVGGVLLWRRLHGRVGAWTLVFPLLGWGATVMAGFINFDMAVGLALLFAAADGGLERLPPGARAGVRAGFAGLLMVVHVFGFVFYAALLAALALGPAIGWGSLPRAARRVGAAALPLIGVGAAFVLLSPHLPGAQAGAGPGSMARDFVAGWRETAGWPGQKVWRLFLALYSYDRGEDLAAAVSLGLVLLISGLRVRVHAGMALATVALVAGYFLCPQELGGTWWIDARFAVLAAFAGAAALRPVVPGWTGVACAALLLGVSLWRTGTVAAIWHARQDDVRAVARALDGLAPGQRLLALANQPRRFGDEPPGRIGAIGWNNFNHLAVLALPWREAFVPTLFAARGKQPVEVTAAMAPLADPEGGRIPSPYALSDAEEWRRSLPDAPYLPGWREHFDVALLLNADVPDRFGEQVPAGLVLVRDEGFAKLYRIVR